jgi:hypothetical protein
MSWSDLVTAQNSNQHITDVFNNAEVLTLENPTSVKEIQQIISSDYQIIPNPASEIVDIVGKGITGLEIIDLSGKVVFKSTGPTNEINVQSFAKRIYLLRIFQNQNIHLLKLMIN